jgi:predicted thioesterase
MATLTVGMRHTLEVRVTPEMTAEAHGNRGVPVLASPRLLGLFEEAAIAAMAPGLEPGEGSVGTDFAFRHLAPTPVGMTARITATLTAVDGRVATFRLEAADERETIAEGTHGRAVIDVARFLGRVAKKTGA